MNAIVGENQKLRDELAATRNELTTALTRVDATERGLHNLETLESRLDDASLVMGDDLFNSEKFRTTVQSEVKSSIGYYWPSLKTDMRDQLWKELPQPVKEYVEKEKTKLTDEVVLVRSELVSLQQKSTAGGNVQDCALAIAELKEAVGQIEKKQVEFERALRGSTPTAPRLTSTLAQSDFTGHRLPDPLAVSLPGLPPKPPSPWVENPRNSPQQRRGGEMSPAPPDQCSHPFHQGPDDEANVFIEDPRRSAPPSRSPSALQTTSADTPYSGPNPAQSTAFRTIYEQVPPSTPAPPTPAPPHPFHGTHPSHVVQLEINGSSHSITNPEPLVITPSPRPPPSMPAQPALMSHSESTSSIPTRPPGGMHPDRIALLSTRTRPPPTATSTQIRVHATPDGSQQRPSLEERLADRSQSSPIFFPGANAIVPLRDEPTSSSSRITLDDVTTSPTLRIPNQNQSLGGMGMGDRKRRASESFLPPRSPKPPKIHKVGKGTGVGGPGGPKGPGKSKNRRGRPGKKRKKARQNRPPGPPNLTHEEGEVEDEDERNDGYAYEGGVYGGSRFGDEPDRGPAYPHERSEYYP